MHFLVVDDSSTMRRIISNTLKKIGYSNITEAEDGKDALSKLDGSINIVITDWNMPNMDGLEFVKQVRSGPYKAVPILMVTTNAAKDDVIQALKAGVNNYVVKPMTPETLEEKVNAILK
ncbi:MAG: response regulator [Acidobacteriota bacterium]|nr:response regulator [Acidobacteriota bacterium]